MDASEFMTHAPLGSIQDAYELGIREAGCLTSRQPRWTDGRQLRWKMPAMMPSTRPWKTCMPVEDSAAIASPLHTMKTETNTAMGAEKVVNQDCMCQMAHNSTASVM